MSSSSIPGSYSLPTPTPKRQYRNELLGRTPGGAVAGSVRGGRSAASRVRAGSGGAQPRRAMGAGPAQTPRLGMQDVLDQMGNAEHKAKTYELSARDARTFVRSHMPSNAGFAKALRKELRAAPDKALADLFTGKTLHDATELVKKVQARLEPGNMRAQLLALSPAGGAVERLRDAALLPDVLADVPDDGSSSLQDQFAATLKERSLAQLTTIEQQLERSEKATLQWLNDTKQTLDGDTKARWDALRAALESARNGATTRQQEERRIDGLSPDAVRAQLRGPTPTLPLSSPSRPETKQPVAQPPDVRSPRTPDSVTQQVKDLLAQVGPGTSVPRHLRSQLQTLPSHDLEAMRIALRVLGDAMTEPARKKTASALADAIEQARADGPQSTLSTHLDALLSAVDAAALAQVVDGMPSGELAHARSEITLQHGILENAFADNKTAGLALSHLQRVLDAIDAKDSAAAPPPDVRDVKGPGPSPSRLGSSPQRTLQSVNEQVQKLLARWRSGHEDNVRDVLRDMPSHELNTLSQALDVMRRTPGLLADSRQRAATADLQKAIADARRGQQPSALSKDLAKLQSAHEQSPVALDAALHKLPPQQLASLDREIQLRTDIYRQALSGDQMADKALTVLMALHAAIQKKLHSSAPAGVRHALQDALADGFKRQLQSSGGPKSAAQYFGLAAGDAALTTLLAPVGGFARQLGKARNQLGSERAGSLTQQSLPRIKKAAQELLAAAREASAANGPEQVKKGKKFLDAAARLRETLRKADADVQATIHSLSNRWFQPSTLERNGLRILQTGVQDNKAGGLQQKPQALLPPQAGANPTAFDDASGLYRLADGICTNTQEPPADLARALLKAVGA